jgi:hypothetical protein
MFTAGHQSETYANDVSMKKILPWKLTNPCESAPNTQMKFAGLIRDTATAMTLGPARFQQRDISCLAVGHIPPSSPVPSPIGWERVPQADEVFLAGKGTARIPADPAPRDRESQEAAPGFHRRELADPKLAIGCHTLEMETDCRSAPVEHEKQMGLAPAETSGRIAE